MAETRLNINWRRPSNILTSQSPTQTPILLLVTSAPPGHFITNASCHKSNIHTLKQDSQLPPYAFIPYLCFGCVTQSSFSTCRYYTSFKIVILCGRKFGLLPLHVMQSISVATRSIVNSSSWCMQYQNIHSSRLLLLQVKSFKMITVPEFTTIINTI